MGCKKSQEKNVMFSPFICKITISNHVLDIVCTVSFRISMSLKEIEEAKITPEIPPNTCSVFDKDFCNFLEQG
jgi:hypothetical protein